MPALSVVFHELTTHFTHEPHWWPIHTEHHAYEVTLGMVLVQQTRWEMVEAAVLRLLHAGYTNFTSLADANPQIITELCKPCAFYTRKGPALVALAQQICARPDGMAGILALPRHVARHTLLALPQIGRESADTILLYAGHHPLFIVDAYARRFLTRSGIIAHLVDASTAPYDVVQSTVETLLPMTDVTTARELHAMMVEVCIHHCTASTPRCMQRGYQRRFVDTRKCADHCHTCTACPAVQWCQFVG